MLAGTVTVRGIEKSYPLQKQGIQDGIIFSIQKPVGIFKMHLPRKLRQNEAMGAKVMWVLEIENSTKL